MKHTTVALLALSLSAAAVRAADDYKLGPDSSPQAGVPQGKEEKLPLPTSKIFPGSEHECWVYVPAQYDAAKPASVMVFQDGGGYVKRDGGWRVPVVFDNLIARGDMPVTIGIFINPGVLPAAGKEALPRYNRSFEYDGLGDTYAKFLIEEVLPEVKKKWNITDDPSQRAIAGASSGAIAAFTAAWERPDAFRRVFSTIGTYTALRGGDQYHVYIRKCEPKPLRVFLQDGSNDLNIYGGDWWIANQQMLSALTFSGYAVQHEWGDGGHNGKQGGSILPQAMKWLWQEKEVKAQPNDKQPVMKITVPGADWELAGEGYKFTEGPTTAPNGEVFFADGGNQRIHKIGLDGKVTVFAENTGGADGMCFGPDGRLYACCNRSRTISAWDITTGKSTVITGDVDVNDCVVNHKGDIWFTDHKNRQIYHVSPTGEKQVVAKNHQEFPNGIELSPDQTLLYVADTRGRFVWSYQVQPDGRLANGQRYYHLHQKDEGQGSGMDGLALDTGGWLYVCSPAGIQVCDQAGRVNSILNLPPNKRAANLCFGGPKMDTLYVCAGDKVYRRVTQAKGVRSCDPPQKPAPPRL
jgi:sugar lactone lactonase YvrE/enterochelin esterase-like enzyme